MSYVAATAAAWAALGALWASGALRPATMVVFVAVVVAAAAFVVWAAAAVTEDRNGLRSTQRAVLFGLFAAVPVAFDPLSFEVVNVVKLCLVMVVAAALVALVALEALRQRRAPAWRNGLQWPVLCLLALAGVATITSVAPRVSLLGAYGSFDGLAALAGFAVVFFATAHTFRLAHVKLALAVVYFAGAGPVAFYGLIQLHDRMLGTPHWDWVEWAASTFVGTSIWSTLGNPNHLAGFLAVMLPLGVVLAFVYPRWWVRAAIAAVTGALLLEMLQTTTRGAWLGALAALATLGILLWETIRRRPRAAVAVVMGLGVMLGGAAVLLDATTHDLSRHVRSAFDLGGKSTAVQRVELWQAAGRMANDRPLVGTGPDTYHLAHSVYQSPKFVRLYGPEQIANGAHNVFMNYLATHGYPGLVIFVALVGLAGLRGVGAWRRLGWARRGGGDEADQRLAAEGRLVLAGVAAALVAYVVQASFNTQQVGLTFVFWALLGLLAVVATAAGVPDTLRPTRLVARPSPDHEPLHLSPRPQPRRQRGPARAATIRARNNDTTVGAMGALCAVVFVVYAAVVSAPYRADRHFRAGLALDERAKEAGASGRDLVLRAREEMNKAVSLNPWEPSYPARLGENSFGLAMRLPPGSPRQLAGLADARSHLSKAAEVDGAGPYLLESYARVLFAISKADPSQPQARDEAAAVLRRAVRANPADEALREALRQVTRR